MDNDFFEHPILNSPYEYPARHWELDAQGQPTQQIIEARRLAEFITPIPQPRRRRATTVQQQMVFDEGLGLSTEEQQYDITARINELRRHVDRWRRLTNPNDWQVTPETARLLEHWRHHEFNNIRPFFCQIEAVETAIWLTEVAPKAGRAGRGFVDYLVNALGGGHPAAIGGSSTVIASGPSAGPKESRFWAIVLSSVPTMAVAVAAVPVIAVVQDLPLSYTLTVGALALSAAFRVLVKKTVSGPMRYGAITAFVAAALPLHLAGLPMAFWALVAGVAVAGALESRQLTQVWQPSRAAA